jgi:hypothetical protein
MPRVASHNPPVNLPFVRAVNGGYLSFSDESRRNQGPPSSVDIAAVLESPALPPALPFMTAKLLPTQPVALIVETRTVAAHSDSTIRECSVKLGCRVVVRTENNAHTGIRLLSAV